MASSPRLSKESSVDVLIIGAGPAGVMCANALVQAGVSVRIVDKRPEGLKAGQADALQPRTLEILQSYGLAENIFKEGNHLRRTAYYSPNGGGGIARSNLAAGVLVSDLRYKFAITLHQGAIEDVFLKSMAGMGAVVERAVVPMSATLSESTDELKDPQAYVNTVVLGHIDRQDDKMETIHAKFVVGTDGAHSWVRKAFGIRAEGSVSSSIWGVVDMVPDTDMPDIRNMTYIHSERGTMFIIPREGDIVRLYVQQPDDSDVIDPTTGRADKNRSSPEKILQQVRKMVHPYRMEMRDGRPHWWTIYAVGQRVAERYSMHDRVIIAGDACHTHSPKAGQGMNAALQDSHNLAWKLAWVLKGWANISLLRTYESERRKFAQDLIEFDKKWSKLFITKSNLTDGPHGRNRDSEQLLNMTKTFSGFTSGAGICYGPSSIVNIQYQFLAPGLVVGARVPPQVFIRAGNGEPVEIQDFLLSDTRFKVLVFGGDVTNSRDAERLGVVADEMASNNSFLYCLGQGDRTEAFEVFCFSKAKQEDATYADFPRFFRPHWSKVLLDDVDVHGHVGGNGYKNYGIDPNVGAIVLVRPDGHVGAIFPLDHASQVTAYFKSFML